MFALSPAKALPLFPAAELNAYIISESPCGPALLRPARPAGTEQAMAENNLMTILGAKTAIIAIFISYASTFLPRNSGVRPTIRPAIKTVIKTKIIIPYNPEPTPPNMISPSIMLNIETSPDRGDKLSCMQFTAPQEVLVVVTDHNTLFITPNLVSFPSMLPATCNTLL